MKLKQSKPVELPDALRHSLEVARQNVTELERKGQVDTYWHDELRRLEGIAASFTGQHENEAGEPQPDMPPQDNEEEEKE